jgi:hypothetical protein
MIFHRSVYTAMKSHLQIDQISSIIMLDFLISDRAAVKNTCCWLYNLSVQHQNVYTLDCSIIIEHNLPWITGRHSDYHFGRLHHKTT